MSELVWVVIRQDDNGNRYRVGRYATRREAERVADTLDARGHKQLYLVERIDRRAS
ncbi:SPOR domain-containing protein [Actinacidiphila sp. bgisy160]|uniref:SPOR domain-containing protein n=1 Tax=Actinacidiphila sp. bgisy160 TaxID=3413796 RepID=UPI003D71ED3B